MSFVQSVVSLGLYIHVRDKYHLNDGWCEFQNVDGYGTSDTLFNVFESDFKSLIDNICSKQVTRFRANDGDTSAIIDEPQFLPTFYFTHALKYDVDQFDLSKRRYYRRQYR